MRLLLLTLALALALSPLALPATALAQAGSPEACVQDTNVDTCWKAGVEAEKRQDSAAALAHYDRSCDAEFQLGGCYEAGKIYFLNPAHRNYVAAEDRLVQVCDSDDIGIGPYACKYLGIVYRDGLVRTRDPELAFRRLSRACFLHNADPFIDGQGCEILAESLPSAREMGVTPAAWPRPYVAYLAYAMGCTDGMPALCGKARLAYARTAATAPAWLARCKTTLGTSCQTLADAPIDDDFERRQRLRRTIVRLFRTITNTLPT